MAHCRLAILAILAASMLPDSALAQSRTRLMDVPLGTHVGDLPQEEWVDPSCGTNGGPPSIELEGFADFARCPVEAATGLRELWFIYDDEWEFIARAYRDPVEIRSYSANVFFTQPIITSILVDGDGFMRGYRIITDPEAPNELRREAHTIYPIVKGQFSDAPWQCVDLPAANRETPVEGRFIKTDCTLVSETRFVRAEVRFLRKPGQNPREYAGQVAQTEGFFESSVRLEVYDVAAIRGAPCCQAP